MEALRALGHHVIEFNLAERLTFYEAALFETWNDPLSGKIAVKKALTGEQATELALNGLYAALYKTRPEVMLAISGFFLEPEMMDHIRRSGTKLVLLHTESPYEDERQIRLAPHADLNLLNDPINIEQYAKVCNVRYVPHAYRPAIHHPGPSELDPMDFSFVGTGFASRIEFFEKMDFTGLRNVTFAGNWQPLDDDSPLRCYVAHDLEECLDNVQTAEIYRATKVGMNLYRQEAERPELVRGLAVGPREVEMAACGLFFLRDPRPEGDHIWPMLPTFSSPEEASELIRWWVAHPREREKVADQARNVISGRTFDRFAKDLTRILEA